MGGGVGSEVLFVYLYLDYRCCIYCRNMGSGRPRMYAGLVYLLSAKFCFITAILNSS